MARDFTGTGSQIAVNSTGSTWGAAVNGASAVSIAVWANLDAITSGANDNRLMSAIIGSSLTGLTFAVNGTGATKVLRVGGRSVSGDGFQFRDATSNFSLSAWHHCGGVLNFGADTITPYFNGVAENSGAATFANAVYTSSYIAGGDYIGAAVDGSASVNGRLAELAIWNVDIGAEGFALLAKGVSPLSIRPEALVSYYRLLGAYSTEHDEITGRASTVTNATKAAHPRITYPLRSGSIPIAISTALTNNLISYWKLDEASGTRYDSHGTNDLADNGTVTSATGKLGAAGDFEVDNIEYLSIASNSSLNTGDIDFTFSAWVRLESKGANRFIIAKDHITSGQREYALYYSSVADRFRFELHSATDSATNVTANALGSPALSTWYFIVAWYDSAADMMYIQVNNGTVNSAAKGTLQAGSSAEFRIGARQYTGLVQPFDGLIDEVGFWKRVLTSDERTQLYNSGSALPYPFDGSLPPYTSGWADFYMRDTGSNLNSGSTTSTTATHTYASGNLTAPPPPTPLTFTVASGDPVADGVDIGDWASVYPDGNTVTPFIGKVIARTRTTISIDQTNDKFGSPPTGGTGNRTLKIGGAWEDFELCAAGGALNNQTVTQSTRININNGDYYPSGDRTLGLVGTTTYKVWWRGYWPLVEGEMDNPLAITGPAIYQSAYKITFNTRNIISNIQFYSFDTSVLTQTGDHCVINDCAFYTDGSGATTKLVVHSSTTKVRFISCWFYCFGSSVNPFDISNTPPDFIGCDFDCEAANCIETTGGLFYRCRFVRPASYGIKTATGSLQVVHCTFYKCGSDSIRWTSTPGASIIANNMFVLSGGYDINNASGASSTSVLMGGNTSYSATSGHTSKINGATSGDHFIPQKVDSVFPYIASLPESMGADYRLKGVAKALDSSIPKVAGWAGTLGPRDSGHIQRRVRRAIKPRGMRGGLV